MYLWIFQTHYLSFFQNAHAIQKLHAESEHEVHLRAVFPQLYAERMGVGKWLQIQKRLHGVRKSMYVYLSNFICLLTI